MRILLLQTGNAISIWNRKKLLDHRHPSQQLRCGTFLIYCCSRPIGFWFSWWRWGSSYYVVHAAAISPRFSSQQCSTTSFVEKIIRVSSHEPITCCRKPYNKFHTHPKRKTGFLSLSLSLIIPLLLHWRSCIRKTKKRESKALHVGKCVGTGIVFLLQKSRRVSTSLDWIGDRGLENKT